MGEDVAQAPDCWPSRAFQGGSRRGKRDARRAGRLQGHRPTGRVSEAITVRAGLGARSLARGEGGGEREGGGTREGARAGVTRARKGWSQVVASTGQLGGVTDGVLLPAKDCSTVAPAPGTASAPLTVPPRVQGARDLLLRG